MTIKDANITLMVSKLDESIQFYRSIGFSLNQRWGNHFAQLSASGLIVGLHPAEPHQLIGNSGNVSIGLTSEHFETIANDLKQLSIDFSIRNEEGGAFIHFKDPDGTSLYFIQPKW